MPRYLVIANQTVESPQLLDAIRQRAVDPFATFHLLVPEDHSTGMTWEEGRAHVDALRRLDDALEHFESAGIEMNGEVDVSPVDGTGNILRREGPGHFDEILISTLPVTVSRWLKMDAPSRIARLTTVPVTHVVAVMSTS